MVGRTNRGQRLWIAVLNHFDRPVRRRDCSQTQHYTSQTMETTSACSGHTVFVLVFCYRRCPGHCCGGIGKIVHGPIESLFDPFVQWPYRLFVGLSQTLLKIQGHDTPTIVGCLVGRHWRPCHGSGLGTNAPLDVARSAISVGWQSWLCCGDVLWLGLSCPLKGMKLNQSSCFLFIYSIYVYNYYY